MNLREWTVLYIKHKDVFSRKLVNYKEEDGKLVFHFKDHHMHAYALDQLQIPSDINGKTLITTLNTEQNMSYLIKHWHSFAKHAHLTLMFVNPVKNEKWFIVPHTHAQIADPNIAFGIKAMSENVTLI